MAPRARRTGAGSGCRSFHACARPMLDVEQTKSVLTHVISRTSVLGKAPIFEITYQGDTGRKHNVEFWHVFRKAEEVYLWRNFVACLQHEADSGEKPDGKWKSLPKEVAAWCLCRRSLATVIRHAREETHHHSRREQSSDSDAHRGAQHRRCARGGAMPRARLY
jgi:hypothetical protein